MLQKLLPLVLASALCAGIVANARAQSSGELLNAGLRELEAKDFARARTTFSLLVGRDPSATNIAYLAVAESGGGDLPKAIKDFTRSINLGDDSLLVHYGLGSAYLRNGDPASAARELRIAIGRDPTYMPARYALGVALLQLVRPKEAIQFLEEAKPSMHDNPEYWLTLVRAQFDAGDPASANATATETTEAFVDHPSVSLALAKLCLQHEQAREAQDLLEEALESNPKNPEIKLLLARVCLQAGDPREALTILRSLPAGSGPPAEILLLTGEARALTGDFVLAQADIASALQNDPQNTASMLVAAWLDQIQGRHRQALFMLCKVRAPDREHPEVLYQAAVSYFFLGNYAQASSNCKAVARLEPLSSRAFFLLGLCKLEERNFERAIALKPKAAMYHREFGVALLELGIVTKSEAELGLALSLDPEASLTYYWRAQLFAREGKAVQAIADLRTCTALDPTFLRAYADLVKLYAAQGQSEKAAAALKAQKRLEQTERSQNPFLSPRDVVGSIP